MKGHKTFFGAYNKTMIQRYNPKLYKVKKGQTVAMLAKEIGVTAYLLAATNGLKEEIFEGQILVLPSSGNLYTVREGDTKALLCGSKKRYEENVSTT